MTHKWGGMEFSHIGKDPKDTGIDLNRLVKLGEDSVKYPSDF